MHARNRHSAAVAALPGSPETHYDRYAVLQGSKTGQPMSDWTIYKVVYYGTERRRQILSDSSALSLGAMALSTTMKRVLFLAAVACTMFIAVEATQVMHRPAGYKEPPHKVKTETKPETKIVHKRAGSQVQFAYFTNWYAADIRITTMLCSLL